MMFLKQVLNKANLIPTLACRGRCAEPSLCNRSDCFSLLHHRKVEHYSQIKTHSGLNMNSLTQKVELTTSQTTEALTHPICSTSLSSSTLLTFSFVFYSHFLSYILSHLFFSSSILHFFPSAPSFSVSLTSHRIQLTVLAESSPEK